MPIGSNVMTRDGAWCWFGDPRAVHFVGEHERTFVGWISSDGEIAVAQYDHRTNGLDNHVVMGGFQVDDHNNPTLCVLPDRRIAVFWTAHAARDYQRIYYRRTAVPEDITSWEPVREYTRNTNGSKSFTYEHLVQLSAEPDKLYVFWRGGNFNPNFAVLSPPDDWSDPKTLVYVEGHRPYLKAHDNGVDRIDFAFTDGHPRNVHTSIFHMYYEGGKLYRTGGSLIGAMGAPAIAPAEATTVYDARSRAKAWIHDVALDPDGHPVLVFATFPGDPEWTGHRYHYARWTGSEWQVHEMCDAGGTIYELPTDGTPPTEPDYTGGISLDHANPAEVLLSRHTPHQVERWTTPDHGITWQVEEIAQDRTTKNIRPIKPRGLTGTGAMSAIWMAGRYTTYVDYATQIMAIGAHGKPIRLTTG